MITLLSPAKKLDLDALDISVPATEPRLASKTKTLAKTAKQQSAGDLKKLMRLSDNLAELNADRFKAFVLNGRSNAAKPAMLTFDGDVYWGLEAKTLGADDLAYAQDHVRILSGLYGSLRPLDKIQPYRLEMGTKLENPGGKNLYEFWGSTIGKALAEDLSGHQDQSILNLASNEYFKAVDKSKLPGKIIDAKFLNIKDGKARSLMYYAKRARGQMARWVIQNRINKAADLPDFDLEGYKIDKGQSSENTLVFTRKQPPKKA